MSKECRRIKRKAFSFNGNLYYLKLVSYAVDYLHDSAATDINYTTDYRN